MQDLVPEKSIDAVAIHLCPACDRKVTTSYYLYRESDHSGKIYRCQYCSMMFGRPVFIPNMAQRQMESVEDAELFDSRLLRKLHETVVIDREIRAVKKLIPTAPASLLDVGCGTGWTTSLWKKAGFRVTGLEPSVIRAEIAAEKYGIRVLPYFLENAPLTEQYDVVVLRHVIEHFAEPAVMLRKVTSILSPGGVVVIIVPNIDCLGRYLFGTDWTWVLPWHCNFFNGKSLETLVKASELTPMRLYRTPSPLYYPEGLARMFPSSVASRVMAKFRIATFMSASLLAMFGLLIGLGDNLTILAQHHKNRG